MHYLPAYGALFETLIQLLIACLLGNCVEITVGVLIQCTQNNLVLIRFPHSMIKSMSLQCIWIGTNCATRNSFSTNFLLVVDKTKNCLLSEASLHSTWTHASKYKCTKFYFFRFIRKNGFSFYFRFWHEFIRSPCWFILQCTINDGYEYELNHFKKYMLTNMFISYGIIHSISGFKDSSWFGTISTATSAAKN